MFTEITRNKVFKPSMCVDRDKGQLMELEVILGNPIRIAKRNGVPHAHSFRALQPARASPGQTKGAEGALEVR